MATVKSVPMPDSATVAATVTVLLLMVRVPVCAPVLAGAKTTPTVQFDCAASVPETNAAQVLFTRLKPEVTASVKLLRLAEVPGLAIVTVFELLLSLIPVALKLIVVGVTSIEAGNSPWLPVRSTVAAETPRVDEEIASIAVLPLDAVPYVAEFSEEINLLYLDADGDGGRGKGIYLDILEAGLDRMPGGSVVIAHNSVNSAEALRHYLAFVVLQEPTRFGNTEIRQFDVSFEGDHDILETDIPVNDPERLAFLVGFCVRVSEAPGDATNDKHRQLFRQHPALVRQSLRELFQVYPPDKLHRDEVNAVGFAKVIRLHDVRVDQIRNEFGFADEILDELLLVGVVLANDFDRNALYEFARSELLGFIHYSHAAFENFAHDLVPKFILNREQRHTPMFLERGLKSSPARCLTRCRLRDKASFLLIILQFSACALSWDGFNSF